MTVDKELRTERTRLILKWAWGIILCAMGINDGNWNVFWFPFIFYQVVQILFKWREAKKFPKLPELFMSWCAKTYTPMLLVMTMSLFIIGNGPLGFVRNLTGNEHYKVISSSTGVRSSHTYQYTLHIPIVERVTNWEEDLEQGFSITAVTSDGKSITAHLYIEFWLIDGKNSAEEAAENFTRYSNLEKAIKQAMIDAFTLSVSKYSLETLPNNLILADLIGSNINLEGLSVSLSGLIKVGEIKLTTAD
jgi:hypothetical protein